jgi:hypothetical protein
MNLKKVLVALLFFTVGLCFGAVVIALCCSHYYATAFAPGILSLGFLVGLTKESEIEEFAKTL